MPDILPSVWVHVLILLADIPNQIHEKCLFSQMVAVLDYLHQSLGVIPCPLLEPSPFRKAPEAGE